ncbi:hypothetical protein [Butyrivibrio sp. INlla21]|uniref:hypothetical protein n=1 Tax=Butyrivibrio sp. INlla21 TaxID=1520811 RepID=UPI0008EFD9AF|nr:hypothetical protein [Butyrivibrio sp. INlla21]SFU57693.1 hypothetical protein SAMN02910342_00960 [Butyrivibrio sp. INlla21]
MFDFVVLGKYVKVKEALRSIEVVRSFYKELWAEADNEKDSASLDEIDERLAELDVMQVELEKVEDECVGTLL